MTNAEEWLEKHKGLYAYFKTHNLPSISPAQGMSLVRVMDGIKDEMEVEKDETIRLFLLAYSEALKFVADVSAIHQKAVIDKLGELIHAGEQEGAETDAGHT